MGKRYLVDGEKLEQDLTSVADAIRSVNGSQETLSFPEGFSEAIRGLSQGGGTELIEQLILGELTEYHSDVAGTLTASAFEGLKKLVSVSLPNITYTNGYVFNNCTALVNVDLPRVTRVSAYVFAGCAALKRLVMPSTSIFGPLTCKGCTSLELADLGTAENIYPNSFDGCTALTALIFRTHKVCMTTQNQTFSNNPIAGGTGYIYVPADQVEAYRAAEFWSAFAGQIRAIEDYPEICGAEGGAAA